MHGNIECALRVACPQKALQWYLTKQIKFLEVTKVNNIPLLEVIVFFYKKQREKMS